MKRKSYPTVFNRYCRALILFLFLLPKSFLLAQYDIISFEDGWRINIALADWKWGEGHQRIFAITQKDCPLHPNSLLAIDPFEEKIEVVHEFENTPSAMALTPGEGIIYVYCRGEEYVHLIRLEDRAHIISSTFPAGKRGLAVVSFLISKKDPFKGTLLLEEAGRGSTHFMEFDIRMASYQVFPLPRPIRTGYLHSFSRNQILVLNRMHSFAVFDRDRVGTKDSLINVSISFGNLKAIQFFDGFLLFNDGTLYSLDENKLVGMFDIPEHLVGTRIHNRFDIFDSMAISPDGKDMVLFDVSSHVHWYKRDHWQKVGAVRLPHLFKVDSSSPTVDPILVLGPGKVALMARHGLWVLEIPGVPAADGVEILIDFEGPGGGSLGTFQEMHFELLNLDSAEIESVKVTLGTTEGSRAGEFFPIGSSRESGEETLSLHFSRTNRGAFIFKPTSVGPFGITIAIEALLTGGRSWSGRRIIPYTGKWPGDEREMHSFPWLVKDFVPTPSGNYLFIATAADDHLYPNRLLKVEPTAPYQIAAISDENYSVGTLRYSPANEKLWFTANQNRSIFALNGTDLSLRFRNEHFSSGRAVRIGDIPLPVPSDIVSFAVHQGTGEVLSLLSSGDLMHIDPANNWKITHTYIDGVIQETNVFFRSKRSSDQWVLFPIQPSPNPRNYIMLPLEGPLDEGRGLQTAIFLPRDRLAGEFYQDQDRLIFDDGVVIDLTDLKIKGRYPHSGRFFSLGNNGLTGMIPPLRSDLLPPRVPIGFTNTRNHRHLMADGRQQGQLRSTGGHPFFNFMHIPVFEEGFFSSHQWLPFAAFYQYGNYPKKIEGVGDHKLAILQNQFLSVSTYEKVKDPGVPQLEMEISGFEETIPWREKNTGLIQVKNIGDGTNPAVSVRFTAEVELIYERGIPDLEEWFRYSGNDRGFLIAQARPDSHRKFSVEGVWVIGQLKPGEGSSLQLEITAIDGLQRLNLGFRMNDDHVSEQKRVLQSMRVTFDSSP